MEYALYVCKTCRDEPDEDCGDACGLEWPDELAPPDSDYWPPCPCCERPAHLVTVLVPQAEAFAVTA